MVRPIMKVHHRYSPRPADGRESAQPSSSPAHRAIGDDVPGYDLSWVLADPSHTLRHDEVSRMIGFTSRLALQLSGNPGA